MNDMDFTKSFASAAALCLALAPALAFAQQKGTQGKQDDAAVLGLSPGAPQVTALPGGVTPSFGQTSTVSSDWRFDVHGYILAPLRFGMGEREAPRPGQHVDTLHAPPRIPGRPDSFDYTGVILDPWNQLNFSYGNNEVTATVIVAARSVANAEGYYNAPDHIGINDAFLTFHKALSSTTALNLNVGAFANTYGNMGEYDLGRYGTPLLFRVGGVGATARGDFKLNDDLTLTAEAGIQGQLNKAPVGVEPASWNGYADPNVGTSFATHVHGLAYFKRTVAFGLHYVHAFVQDDRAAPLPDTPDGSIDVMGADLRFTLGKYGHFYTGLGYTSADTARSVSSVIRVLNAPGGPGLRDEYLGSEGDVTGSLLSVGAQYDFSWGHYLRMRSGYVGQGPDLVTSVFGILTSVKSEDKTTDATGTKLYDGTTKFKYGGEATYSFLSWLAASLRYDRVLPHTDDSDYTTAVISPRLIFKSDWGSRDQVVLQYSYWMNGSKASVFEGDPPRRDATIKPDAHTVMLSASMWW